MTEAAFRELCVRYARAVRSRCRAMMGDTDADEALQEAFLDAWRARDRFDAAHPLAWLHAIARNTCLDMLRRRRPWVDDPVAWLQIKAPTPSSGSERRDIGRLFDDLSPEDAALLRLRYVEEWRIHELAEHFDISERSLRRTLERLDTRARAILRTHEVSDD